MLRKDIPCFSTAITPTKVKSIFTIIRLINNSFANKLPLILPAIWPGLSRADLEFDGSFRG